MPEVGSWPDWVAAAVALGALIVATIAAYATVKTNQAQQRTLLLQQEQINRLTEDKRRRFAEAVIVWWEAPRDASENARVFIQNNESPPILRVRLRINTGLFDQANQIWYALDLGTVRGVGDPIQITLDHERLQALASRIREPLVHLVFTDGAGHTWWRTNQGDLTDSFTLCGGSAELSVRLDAPRYPSRNPQSNRLINWIDDTDGTEFGTFGALDMHCLGAPRPEDVADELADRKQLPDLS